METNSDLERLCIVVDENERLLVNTSDVEATYVAYVTSASIWDFPDEDDVTTTDAPTFVVRSVLAGHGVVIEEVDPLEPGHVSFTLVRAEWADGRIDLGLEEDPPRSIPTRAEADTPRLDRDVTKVGVVPGRVRHGLLAPRPDGSAIELSPATCPDCLHSVAGSGEDQGLCCTHPVHTHGRECWLLPGRWYSCPLHQPDAATSAAESIP